MGTVTGNRKMLSIKLPPELIESLQREAELRGATLTAIVEERLRQVSPLHDKLAEVLRAVAK